MKDRPISNLESRLERLVEGAFAHFFGRKIRAQDIALQISRAMESGLHVAEASDPRPIAPDFYQIKLSPETIQTLLDHQPDLPGLLSSYVLELATNAGYLLENDPVINLLPNQKHNADDISIEARHTNNDAHSTSALQKVNVSAAEDAPQNPQLVVGSKTIPLSQALVNLGRSLENDIVLEDQHVSRHHAQIRLRFGQYTIFDVQSRSGTFINNVQMQQHVLSSGDVIRMGETRIVYLEDKETEEEPTREIDPVEPDKGE